MKLYRVSEKNINKLSSKKASVVVVPPELPDFMADSLISRFPKALLIAENSLDSKPREGYLNVLRVKAKELEGILDFNSEVYRAVLIEDVPAMLYSELLKYREEVALKCKLPLERVRFCCNLLSMQGCDNFSCYAANSIRDLAAEAGIIELAPTSKQEVLSGNSMCLCVKSR